MLRALALNAIKSHTTLWSWPPQYSAFYLYTQRDDGREQAVIHEMRAQLRHTLTSRYPDIPAAVSSVSHRFGPFASMPIDWITIGNRRGLDTGASMGRHGDQTGLPASNILQGVLSQDGRSISSSFSWLFSGVFRGRSTSKLGGKHIPSDSGKHDVRVSSAAVSLLPILIVDSFGDHLCCVYCLQTTRRKTEAIPYQRPLRPWPQASRTVSRKEHDLDIYFNVYPPPYLLRDGSLLYTTRAVQRAPDHRIL